MKKFIMLVFIICFVGSASAAEVTYHFTAEIYDYRDDAEIFSEMGYSADMPLKGTITIDPELEPLRFYLEPHLAGAFNWWNTGVITFEDQGYFWLDSCNRYFFIQNYSTDHEIKIMTKQGNPIVNPDDPEMIQMITLRIDGLDASMPSDFDLGNSPQYVFQITTASGLISIFNANIIEIMNEEEYANSTAQKVRTAARDAGASVDIECPCDGDWKNHGAYVSCVAEAAGDRVKEGLMSKKEKGAIVSEAAKTTCGEKSENKNKKKK